MDLFKKLVERNEDLLFHKYVNAFGGAPSLDNLNYILRYWNTNKESFYKAFGENFILKKEIYFEKSNFELAQDMTKTISTSKVYIKNFINNFIKKVNNIFYNDYEIRWRLHELVNSDTALARNTLIDPYIIPKEKTVDGKSLSVNSGSKTIKMLGKVVRSLDADYEFYLCPKCGWWHETTSTCCNCGKEMEKKSGYELFRQLHSQVLNQRKIKGTLCLSIHPLDYLTMSDNDSGWSSCMSWEEDGDYRLGTIEMMNSPMVVIAYLEGKTPYYFYDNCEWNNKKWRQLYIVTPEIILGNRQYPYDNNSLEDAAISWLKDIMDQAEGYGPYSNVKYTIKNGHCINIENDVTHKFNFTSNYMYNDIYGDRIGYIAPTLLDGKETIINFSGPAVCITCGKIIHENENPANVVECNDCNGLLYKCDHCGRYHSEEESYYVDGYTLCYDCYDYETSYCECCEEFHLNKNIFYIPLYVIYSENNFIRTHFTINVCDECINSAGYESIYGKMYTLEDEEITAFNILEFSEEAINSTNFSWEMRNILKTLKELQTEEACRAYLKEKM